MKFPPFTHATLQNSKYFCPSIRHTACLACQHNKYSRSSLKRFKYFA